MPPALLSEGGGPAGVVEVPKLNKLPGFVVAGVVDPTGAEVEGVVEPKGEDPEVRPPPPNRLPGCDCAAPAILSGVDVVVSLASSGFFPKAKPLPKAAEPPEVLPPPNNPPVVAPLGLPVLAPKIEGVELPEAGLEPKVSGFVASEEPNRLGVEVGCDVDPPNKPLCCVPVVAPKRLLGAVVDGV